jgi:hypothetical protein
VKTLPTPPSFFTPLMPVVTRAAPRMMTLTPTRVADTELEWFFTMAERDMGDRSNYMAALVPARHRDPDTPERRACAARTQRTILGWLRALENTNAGILQVAYSARPWPEKLYDELGRLASVAVRLASAEAGLPDDDIDLDVLERVTAERLTAALAGGRGALARLREEAGAKYAEAFDAYVRVRGDVPSVLQGWA